MNQVTEIQELDDRAGLADAVRDEQAHAAVRARWARLAALAALAVVLAALGRGAVAGYRALTDAYVSPVALSPDSDAVLQDRLALGRLLSERESLAARIVDGRAAVEALRDSLELLQGMEEAASRSLGWAREQVATERVRGTADRALLQQQRQELEATVARQRRYVGDLERSLAAGLVHRADVERERGHLDELELSLLQNQREEASALARERTTTAAGRALQAGARPALSTPEMQAQLELTTRIRLDVLRARSDLSGRQARLEADREQLARVDELVAQVREKPTLKAVNEGQHLAFAPFGELGGVRPGAPVLRCALWGLVGCTQVGKVAQLLPGEVSSPDTWGVATRGQYVLLELADPAAAQSRALRVRGAPATESGPPALVSAR